MVVGPKKSCCRGLGLVSFAAFFPCTAIEGDVTSCYFLGGDGDVGALLPICCFLGRRGSWGVTADRSNLAVGCICSRAWFLEGVGDDGW